MVFKKQKTSGQITVALGNSLLKVIADVDDDPRKVLEMSDNSYASNQTAWRIAVQKKLL